MKKILIMSFGAAILSVALLNFVLSFLYVNPGLFIEGPVAVVGFLTAFYYLVRWNSKV